MVIRGIVEDYLLYHGFGQTYDMILTDAVDQEKSKGKECFSKHHVPPGSTRETGKRSTAEMSCVMSSDFSHWC